MGTQHLIYMSANRGEARILIHPVGLGGSGDYRLPTANSLLVGVPPDVDTRRVGVVLIRAGVVFGQFPLTVQLVQASRVRHPPRGVTFAASAGSPGLADDHAPSPPTAASTGSRPVAEAVSSPVRVSHETGPAI